MSIRRRHAHLNWLIWVFACAVYGCRSQTETNIGGLPHLVLTAEDRILVLAPHPDDEVLGCAGIMQGVVERGLPLQIVFLTYGDSNEWSFLVYRKRPVLRSKAIQQMGLLRHQEALNAAELLGISPQQLTFLGYPDFGMLHMWEAYWGARPSFRSMLTRVSAVPYANARRPGAPYRGEEVLRDLIEVIREFRPTKIFVPHPADYNPDHRALYLFTRVALWDLERELHPELYPYLIHYGRWPRPLGYHPQLPLSPPPVLREQVSWRLYPLIARFVNRKQAALKAHRTQYAYSAKRLLTLVRSNELFGDLPDVPLHPVGSSKSLSLGEGGASLEIPEQLTDREEESFISVDWGTAQLEEHNLVISMTLSRPLSGRTRASIYIFGYRADRPFEDMPKIHIRLGPQGAAVYDQEKRLPGEMLQVGWQMNHVTIRVPLETLGDPERVLSSARTYRGNVPLDWASWRVLDLRRGNMGRPEKPAP